MAKRKKGSKAQTRAKLRRRNSAKGAKARKVGQVCARKSEADGSEYQAQARASEESRAKRSGSSSRKRRY
jgi:hypothetical protein